MVKSNETSYSVAYELCNKELTSYENIPGHKCGRPLRGTIVPVDPTKDIAISETQRSVVKTVPDVATPAAATPSSSTAK